MNYSPIKLLIFFICLLSLVTLSQCNEPAGNKADQSIKDPVLDTASIHEKLRRYEALTAIDNKQKDAVLRSITAEAIAMGYNDKACELLREYGRYYADQGNFDSSLYYYERARSYCFKPVYDKTLPAAFLTEFGAFYHSLQSDNVASNNSYYEALEYLRENNLTENELTINILLYLFATQESLGNPEQALLYLKEAEQLAIKLNSQQALIAVRTNLGNYYSERKDYPTARKYYDLALENEKEVWQSYWDPNILIAALVGKASIRAKTGEALDAVPFLKRAIQTAQDNNIVYSEVVAAIELGGVYNRLGRFGETIQLVSAALKAQEGFNWYREEGYRALMDAYEGQGQYKQALEYQRKLNAFEDSIANTEKKVAINKLELEFQTAKKDKEIASNQLLIEQQKNKLARTNTLIAAISGAAILAVLLLVIVYKNAAHKQRVRELEINTLRSKQEIDLLRSTMQGEEQERQRLSRELHDGIGSMISSAIMRLSLLKKRDMKSITASDFDDVLNLLQDTGSEVRKTAQNMMPDVIYKQSLFEAVKNYCDSISQSAAIKIDVQFYGSTSSFSPHCKLVIYRIIQELVHNVVKHSRATLAIVQGVVNDNSFTLTVEDNGSGFDTTASRSGMGLKNVDARVKSMYGEFQVESTPGKGTTIYIELDCKRLAEEEKG